MLKSPGKYLIVQSGVYHTFGDTSLNWQSGGDSACQQHSFGDTLPLETLSGAFLIPKIPVLFAAVPSLASTRGISVHHWEIGIAVCINMNNILTSVLKVN